MGGAAKPDRDAKERCILVAEDHDDALYVVSLILRMKGHRVETATDGEEAFEKIRTLRPDVALLDIGMPLLDGYEVARRIREQAWGGTVLLIAMTGWGQERDKQRAFDAGFDEHLTKPMDYEVLEEILESRGR